MFTLGSSVSLLIDCFAVVGVLCKSHLLLWLHSLTLNFHNYQVIAPSQAEALLTCLSPTRARQYIFYRNIILYYIICTKNLIPPGYRSSLARTTVVNTHSESWPRMLSAYYSFDQAVYIKTHMVFSVCCTYGGNDLHHPSILSRYEDLYKYYRQFLFCYSNLLFQDIYSKKRKSVLFFSFLLVHNWESKSWALPSPNCSNSEPESFFTLSHTLFLFDITCALVFFFLIKDCVCWNLESRLSACIIYAKDKFGIKSLATTTFCGLIICSPFTWSVL